jgi:hypothetical protein
MSSSIIPFSFQGVPIHRNEAGLVSLTDLHRAAGGAAAQRPANWLQLPATSGFMAATRRFLNVAESYIIKTTRGKGGGTYAHQHVALEYAQYLSPDLAVAVNQVFLERVAEEQNPDLILDRAEATYQRKGYSAGYIRARLLGKVTRNQLTSTLGRHGVRGDGFRLATNATYEPLLGGTAAEVRQVRNLPERANLREHLSEAELVGLHLAELLATESIEAKHVRGNQNCANECRRAASNVARAIVSHRQR